VEIIKEAKSMAQFATENIRTLALVGHGASGKTTLAEALLLKSGSVQVAGPNGATTPTFTWLSPAQPAMPF